MHMQRKWISLYAIVAAVYVPFFSPGEYEIRNSLDYLTRRKRNHI